MAGMPMKEISALVGHLEPQGVTTTRTKKGLMLRLPDGTSTMLHFTGSDVRERDNVRARIHRAGLSWPGDDLTASAQRTPSPRNMARAQAVLDGFDGDSIRPIELARLVTAADGQKFSRESASRVLHALGWSVMGRTSGQRWHRPAAEPEPLPELVTNGHHPEPIEPEPTEPEPTEPELVAEPEPEPWLPAGGIAVTVAPELVAEPEPIEPEPIEPEPEPEPHPDAAVPGSWAMELEHLPAETTIAQLWVYIAALGLQGEVRVWRHG
jgi:hypothetical protein